MDGIALPLLSLQLGFGFGYGVVGGMFLRRGHDDALPHALAAQVFFSARGVRTITSATTGRSCWVPLRLEATAGVPSRRMRSPFFGRGQPVRARSSGERG